MKLQVGVKALIRNNRGEYLFLHRTKIMTGESEAHWDIPGGRIEIEENLLEALQREIFEETKLKIDDAPILFNAQDIFVASDLHVVRLTYVVNGDGDVILSDEHQAYRWATPSEADALNTDPYLRESLQIQKTLE
jgi:8-oxo-dGTP diphosphatase